MSTPVKITIQLGGMPVVLTKNTDGYFYDAFGIAFDPVTKKLLGTNSSGKLSFNTTAFKKEQGEILRVVYKIPYPTFILYKNTGLKSFEIPSFYSVLSRKNKKLFSEYLFTYYKLWWLENFEALKSFEEKKVLKHIEKRKAKEDYIKILVPDVIFIITSYLTKKDKLSLSASCTYMKNIIDQKTKVVRYKPEIFTIINCKNYKKMLTFLEIDCVKGKEVSQSVEKALTIANDALKIAKEDINDVIEKALQDLSDDE